MSTEVEGVTRRSRRHVRCKLVLESTAGSNSSRGRQLCKRNATGEDCPFVECVATTCSYSYPLKIMTPSCSGTSCCQWVYPVTYGGGLVEGDQIHVEVTVKENCCVLWTSQSYLKVYPCDGGMDSGQHLRFTVSAGSLLCVLPDPTVCFERSSYSQTQEVILSAAGSVVLLDWCTSGRQALHERWHFTRLRSITTISVDERITLREAMCLEDTPHLTVGRAMAAYNVVGFCAVIGTHVLKLAKRALDMLGQRNACGKKPDSKKVFAASPYRHLPSDDDISGCVIRFAATSTSQAYDELERILEPLVTVIGGNPFQSKH